MPVSFFDCQYKILSDTYLEMIEAIDWQCFSSVEKNNKRGRPSIYSKIALLKALVYMELAGIPSVSKLVRILAGELYKLEILDFNQLRSESTFSRFKESNDIDRIVRIMSSHSLLMNGLFTDIAYDSKGHIEPIYPLGIPMIIRTNRRNTKKELPG